MPQQTIPASVQKAVDETKVDYVRLGSSGLRVSVPILGCMMFGHERWAPGVQGEEAALEIIKAAYDRGINTWDTANTYSNGISERIVGKALKRFNIPRHKVVIMTKCSQMVSEDVEAMGPRFAHLTSKTKEYVNQSGPSRAAIFNSLEASLARLDIDYIDVLQLHRYNGEALPEETMKALHDLVQSGKVRYIGASSMWATQFATLQFVAERNGWTKFISMQSYYNLCYREEEREMIRFCKATGVGVMAWSPLSRGNLAKPLKKPGVEGKPGQAPARPVLTPADEVIIERVEEVAAKNGWSMAQVGLIWLKMKGAVSVTGINSVARVDEATELRDKELTDEEVLYLEEPYVPKPVVGHV